MNRTSQLNPAVVDWLARQAPAFHRWGWLWLYEHALGQSTNLLSKPDRNWVIESLALGYPSEQIEEILAAAETTAFQSGDFANAVRLRWLKTRLLNGPEFQIDDFDSLIDCALQLTDDEFPIKTLREKNGGKYAWNGDFRRAMLKRQGAKTAPTQGERAKKIPTG
jgi:hypothetical protein